MNDSTSPATERCDALLHGWDSKARAWHGPIPLAPGKRRTCGALAQVRTARRAFHGKIRCFVSGLPCIEFYTAVYDLKDTVLAMVHLDGGHGGPVGIVAVVPHGGRGLLKEDFAWELMTLLSFLSSPVNSGCELAIHDYIEESLRKDPSATQIFALETAEVSSDIGIVLSTHFENLSAAMLERVARRELQDAAMFRGHPSQALTPRQRGGSERDSVLQAQTVGR